MKTTLQLLTLIAIAAFALPSAFAEMTSREDGKHAAIEAARDRAELEFHVGVSPEDRRDDFGAISGWDPEFGYYGGSDVRMSKPNRASEGPAKETMAELDVGVAPEDRRDNFGAIIGWDPQFGYYGDSVEKKDRVLTCEAGSDHLDRKG